MAQPDQYYPDFESAKRDWDWWFTDSDSDMKLDGSPMDASIEALMRDYGHDVVVAEGIARAALNEVIERRRF